MIVSLIENSILNLKQLEPDEQECCARLPDILIRNGYALITKTFLIEIADAKSDEHF